MTLMAMDLQISKNIKQARIHGTHRFPPSVLRWGVPDGTVGYDQLCDDWCDDLLHDKWVGAD